MLRIRQLTKRFGPRRGIFDVDLEVAAGEIVALVGENGAGKSTLVKCVGGVLPCDGGEVVVDGGPGAEVAVVWQDLALCDNLDTVANVFLGAELGRIVRDDTLMRLEAERILADIGVTIDELEVPVGELSGGQRQMVAVARALRAGAPVLILDEPTAALGVNESRALDGLLVRLRARGMAVLMVSHRIDQVFALADRIAVMRHGRIVAMVSPLESHPDDVIALMSGASTDSMARRQIHQLRRLVDELAEVEPAASLPLIVTSLSRTLASSRIGLWLADPRVPDPAGPAAGRLLTLRADVGLDPAARRALTELPEGPAGGVIGVAANGSSVTLDDATADPFAGGISASAWAVPIIGATGVEGVIAGFGERYGRPAPDQLELVELHANLAAVAIEREALLTELTKRNHLLESLRGLLDRLAGPEPVGGGVGVALSPLRDALGADSVALFERIGGELTCRALVTEHGSGPVEGVAGFAAVASGMSFAAPLVHRVQVLAPGVVAVLITETDREAALAARWDDPAQLSAAGLDLLEDAARSLALALEREAADAALRETAALRRANSIQREFLYRLSHELRTPLTAIRGFADTLRQTDVQWDAPTHQQFLERISTESARMGRLVGDLLDTSALEGGGLRLHPDWCDLRLVIDNAIALSVSAPDSVEVDIEPGLPAVWADHDRIEQVFVNLIENATRHGAPPVRVTAHVEGELVAVGVHDTGRGFDTVADRAFDAHARREGSTGAGLGLTIARGIAEGHGGTLSIEPAAGRTCVVLRIPVEPPTAPFPTPGAEGVP